MFEFKLIRQKSCKKYAKISKVYKQEYKPLQHMLWNWSIIPIRWFKLFNFQRKYCVRVEINAEVTVMMVTSGLVKQFELSFVATTLTNLVIFIGYKRNQNHIKTHMVFICNQS